MPVWIGIYATQEMRRDLRTRLGQRAGRYLRCVADNISAGQGGNEGDSRFEEQRKSSTSPSSVGVQSSLMQRRVNYKVATESNANERERIDEKRGTSQPPFSCSSLPTIDLLLPHILLSHLLCDLSLSLSLDRRRLVSRCERRDGTNPSSILNEHERNLSSLVSIIRSEGRRRLTRVQGREMNVNTERAQDDPNFWNIWIVNSGNAAPKRDRRTALAARTEAAYIKYESTR